MDGVTRWPDRPAWGQVFAAAARGAGFGAGELVRLGADIDTVARHCRGRLVYLASPYSHRAAGPDGAFCAEMGQGAADDACAWVAALAVAGVTAISPVALSHFACMESLCRRPLRLAALDPLDAAFWHGWCRPLMHRCDAMVVPEIGGWDASAGIWAEFGWAVTHQRPVFVMAAGPEWAR